MLKQHINRQYNNGPVQDFLGEHLPMKEFMSGNFSQGEKLIVEFRAFVAQCLKEVKAKRRNDKIPMKYDNNEVLMEGIERKVLIRDHFGDSIDNRDLQTVFIEGITSHQIMSNKIPLIEKKKIIEHFQNKVMLFDYICLKYEHGRPDYQRKYFDDLWSTISLCNQFPEQVGLEELFALGKAVYSAMTPEERASGDTGNWHPIRAQAERELWAMDKQEGLFSKEIYQELIKEIPPIKTYITQGGQRRRTDIYYTRGLVPTKTKDKKAA